MMLTLIYEFVKINNRDNVLNIYERSENIMAKFCTSCGAELDENTNFCCACGSPVSNGNVSNISNNTIQGKTVIQTVKTTSKIVGQIVGGSSEASSVSGETMMGSSAASSLFGSVGQVTAILSPIKVIIGGFKSIKSGFLAALKDKKKLIPAIILAISWIVLTLLPALGINPFPVKILSFLTFAQGGMSNNIIKLFGGIIGKAVFASFVFTLFGGGNPLNKLKGYFRSFTSVFKTKTRLKVPVMLFGISFSMIIFNFIVVSATPWSFMAGIATTYLSLKALSGGFLRKLLTSIFAKLFKGKTTDFVKNFLVGSTTGFTLSTAISMFSLTRGPLIFGILILIVAAIWLLFAIVIPPKATKGVRQ